MHGEDFTFTPSNFVLFQQRYLTTQSTDSKDKHNYQWWVPLTYTVPSGDFNDTYPKVWLKPFEGEKRISGMPAAETPVIFNIQETGKEIILEGTTERKVYIYKSKQMFTVQTNCLLGTKRGHDCRGT